MFATGQEWRVRFFCVQSAEEVWNANVKIKGDEGEESLGLSGVGVKHGLHCRKSRE